MRAARLYAADRHPRFNRPDPRLLGSADILEAVVDHGLGGYARPVDGWIVVQRC